MSQNLSAIISQLQSDKLKTRKGALELIDDAFIKSDKLTDALAGNIKEWLAVFQALFTAVSLERAAAFKNGFHKATAASLGRIEFAGLTVRHVTERCLTHLN